MTIRLLAGVALGALLTACTTVEDTAMPATARRSRLPAGHRRFRRRLDAAVPHHRFQPDRGQRLQPGVRAGDGDPARRDRGDQGQSRRPTFDNTIVALERSGRMLARVSAAFGTGTGANTNDALDAVDAEMSPKLSAHSDAINLDAGSSRGSRRSTTTARR
jgi:peptidyl-dipeptidase Dcp